MGLMERLDKKVPSTTAATTQQAEADESAQLRDRVHLQVVETLNKREEKHNGAADETETRAIIESTLEEHAASMARPERNRIAVEIYDSIRGLGPLEKLLAETGLTPVGAVGEICPFDPRYHQRMSGSDVGDGVPVRVRFVGYRFQEAVLLKAMVSRED